MAIHNFAGSVKITAALFDSDHAGQELAKHGFTPAFEVALLHKQAGIGAVSATTVQNGVVSSKDNGLQ